MRLEARNISAAIKGCVIVKECTFKLEPGELVGLIGPNGAGKSTLLKTVLGLREAATGEVLLDGKVMSTIPDKERARAVSFLPQDRRVEWRLPVHDVVMLGRYPHHSGFGGHTPADHAAVDKALRQVDCLALADRPVSVLSGGERTRVLLARALAVEAPLLMVDEPIAALDPYHQIHVMEILRDLARQGAGVLAVIHDLALAARFMDRLILLGDGQIVRDGPPAQVLTDDLLERVYRIDVKRGSDGYIVPWSRKVVQREVKP
jgi:iron complex transport system ATP-binding protein